MDLAPLHLLNAWDATALAIFFLCLYGTGHLIEHSPDQRPSMSRLVAVYRERWMHEVPGRSNRVLDSMLLVSLRNGSAFFASGTMIAVGGLTALLGQAERLVAVARDFGPVSTEQSEWEAKLLFLLFLVVTAFLKFVWSHRLFGYCLIVMGAIPEEASAEAHRQGAARAAELNISAGRNFNRGLRLTYFALAALAWVVGPLALIAATLMTAGLILRREFASRSRIALLEGWTPAHDPGVGGRAARLGSGSKEADDDRDR